MQILFLFLVVIIGAFLFAQMYLRGWFRPFARCVVASVLLSVAIFNAYPDALFLPLWQRYAYVVTVAVTLRIFCTEVVQDLRRRYVPRIELPLWRAASQPRGNHSYAQEYADMQAWFAAADQQQQGGA